MDAPDRPERGSRELKDASAAERHQLAATRRMRLEQVRAAVRAQLAEITRRRQELSARRKPVQRVSRPAAPPTATAKPSAAGTDAPRVVSTPATPGQG
jgi:hypothetical protein